MAAPAGLAEPAGSGQRANADESAVGGVAQPRAGGSEDNRAQSAPYTPQPGGIPLRPLDAGDILDGTFGTIRRNPRATIGLSALLVAVQQVLVLGTDLATGGIPTAGGFATGATVDLIGGIGTILSFVLAAVVGAILTGMIVVVVSEDVLGRRTSIADVWARVRPRIWALLGASVIAGVLPFIGLLFLVVPGVYLWGVWALTTPALILERLGPIQAVRRSWRLVRPDFWRVWGIRALSVLLGWLVQNLFVIPFVFLGILVATALGSDDGDALPLIAIVFVILGTILGGMIAEPFLAGVVALLYVDRRMRAEGLDIVLQQQVRAARRTPMVAASSSPGPVLGVPARPGGAT